MKNMALVLLSIIIVHANTRSQTTILAEPFENSLTGFTTAGVYSFFSGTITAPVEPQGTPAAVQGSFSLGMTNTSVVLNSAPINTLNYVNMTISLRVAAIAVNGVSGGLDQVDRVRVALSTNGGAFYTDYVTVTGAVSGNSYWGFNATGTASTAYPNVLLLNAASTGLNPNGYSTITITDIPSVADLRIRIGLNCGANERWMIDNFLFVGTSTLPIKLVSFTGSTERNDAILKWTIAEPEEGGVYELQRSADAADFTTVYRITGNAVQTAFVYNEAAAINGRAFYRLRMTDRENKVAYSHIVRLFTQSSAEPELYPTRTGSQATLQVNDRKLLGTTAALINSNGNKLRTYLIRNDFEIISLESLPAGMYILQLANGKAMKLIKE